jgi:POT family proton-dependent oligopeptide transporter
MGGPAIRDGECTAISTRHPAALYFFWGGEFAERASYYGMRVILFLYLSQAFVSGGLGYPDTQATQIQAYFKMACYLLPLLGGFLADRFFGKYWTIVGFSIPYVLGHFILGIQDRTAMVIALALLAGGSGVIKPNISTLMGMTYDQQRPGHVLLRTAAFQWFYFAVNVGAFISQFALPFLRDKWGFATAFQFPAWLMVGALIIFALGKKFYAVETVGRSPAPVGQRGNRWNRFKAVLRLFFTLRTLFVFFFLVILFWIPYEQNDGLWLAFSRDYVNRHVPFVHRELSPDQLQFINPLFVIILIPVFNGLFRIIDPHVRIFTPFLKILLGFLLTAASSGILALAGAQVREYREQVRPIVERKLEALQPLKEIEEREAALRKENGDLTEQEKVDFEKEKEPFKEVAARFDDEIAAFSHLKVSIWWMVIAYIVLTVGEVLLYGTALELAYTMAPENMKGFITACFLVTNALANYFNTWFNPKYGGSLVDPADKLGPLAPGAFFGILGSMALAAAIMFCFIGRKFGQQPDGNPVSAEPTT